MNHKENTKTTEEDNNIVVAEAEEAIIIDNNKYEVIDYLDNLINEKKYLLRLFSERVEFLEARMKFLQEQVVRYEKILRVFKVIPLASKWYYKMFKE